jgi:hypothetical protein
LLRLSRVVTVELGFLLATALSYWRGERIRRDSALERKRVRPTPGFLVVDSITNPVELVHQDVELILYFFQTVLLACHAVLSVGNTKIEVQHSKEQN